jgi:CheY-like chemotaxis protein
MKNVLLVDDDRTAQFLGQVLLRKCGVTGDQVHTANNGQHALELLSDCSVGNVSPDLILLDLNMPILDGFGFLEAFRLLNNSQKRNVKIIVLSSSCDPRDEKRAMELGASLYLPKPLGEKSLMEILTVHC